MTERAREGGRGLRRREVMMDGKRYGWEEGGRERWRDAGMEGWMEEAMLSFPLPDSSGMGTAL